MLKLVNEYLTTHKDRLFQQWIDLVNTPAPSGHEQARGVLVKKCFEDAQLKDVRIDELGNVIGTLPGPAGAPHVVVAPHMDTVFRAAQMKPPVIRDGRIYAPGVRDNTAGVAAVLAAVQTIAALQLRLPVTVTFVATVQEEVGLKGMQYFLEHHEEPIHCLLAVDGPLGNILYGGPGVHWIRFAMKGPGGHAWQYHGRPSAVHGMAQFVCAVTDLAVPKEPKTTVNVGTFQGGTVPNAIAQEAEIRIDLRSEEQQALDTVTAQIMELAEQTAAKTGLTLDVETLNHLPAGALPGGPDHPLVQAAQDILQSLGQPITEVGFAATDANPGNAAGIPSLAVGGTSGDKVHSLEEYADIEPFYNGIRQILLLLERIPDCI